MNTSIASLFIAIVIVIALFFLLRNLVLWYYRINDRFILQDETNQLLTEILKELREKK